jgi:hypothetical protein
MNLKNLSPVRRRALTPIQSFFRSVAEKGRFLRPVIKAEHKHRLFAFFMLGVLFTAFLFLFFHTISSRMQSVSQVSALTEKVEFQVTQPGLAAIPLRQMRLATSDQSLDGKCIEGLIVPALGANVIYGRTGYGPLSIQILPPKTDPQSTIAGKFEPSDNSRALALNGNIYIESDPACSQVLAGIPSSAVTPSTIPLPMPIWGKAKIGSEFKGIRNASPEPALLLSGQIKVSARAIVFLPWLLDMGSTLYPVTVLDLPVGSRLETYDSSQNESIPAREGADYLSNWWGTAYVDSEKPALNIELATDTPRLALFRPNRHEPDIIETSHLNQIFEDPNLIKVYKIFAVLASAATISGWLLGAFEMRTENAKDKGINKR